MRPATGAATDGFRQNSGNSAADQANQKLIENRGDPERPDPRFIYWLAAMDDLRRDPGWQLETLSAQLRADSVDGELFLEVLAGKLNGALPAQTHVEWGGGLLNKRRVRSVEVQLGEHRYAVGKDGQGLVARHLHTVRGVVLRTEQLEVRAWIEQLCAELGKLATVSEQSRAAMERLLQ